MRYVGGKTKIASWVLENIAATKGDCTHYIEPFVGSGAVFYRAAPLFDSASCGDSHEDLILLLQAIADGWEPPTFISREQYAQIKHAPPSALRGFAGFGSSFGGKWFGGWVDQSFDKSGKAITGPFAAAAAKSLTKMAGVLADAHIVRQQYHEWAPGLGDFVYCDPPYAGTQGYGSDFDHDKFWEVATTWAKGGATVLVSESNCERSGWTVLAERTRKALLRVAKGVPNSVRVERLYVYE